MTEQPDESAIMAHLMAREFARRQVERADDLGLDRFTTAQAMIAQGLATILGVDITTATELAQNVIGQLLAAARTETEKALADARLREAVAEGSA